MKTDLVDVNETRKNLNVEIPSDVVDARDRPRRDGLLAQGAHSRLPSGQGAGARHQAALQGSDPARRRARSRAARHRRCAARARRRAGRHARRPRRHRRGRPGADLHGVVRHACRRSRSATTRRSRSARPSSRDRRRGGRHRRSQRLRDRAARFEPVEGRGVVDGDIVTRRPRADRRRRRARSSTRRRGDRARREREPARASTSSCSASRPAATKSFTIHYPADYPIGELANTDVSYTVTVKAIKRRVLPELDDEFAKDLGEFETLEALRARVREDLEHEARHAAERAVRGDLMKQLAARVPFEVPASLVEREIDRRLEEFAGRLMDQSIDPRQAGIDWKAFRESQREPAREAVASALALDEVARREQLDGRARRRSNRRSRATPSGRAGRRPRCARRSKRRAGCRACTRVCAGRSRLTSSWRVLQLRGE